MKKSDIRGSILITPRRGLFLVNHVGFENKRGSGTYADSRDEAIAKGRKVAMEFNTDLFIENDNMIVELEVESPEEKSVLTKVRGLLNKGEGTDVDAERDAFLAKAQELMTRHAIDEKQARGEGDNGMIKRKIAIGKGGAGIWSKRNLIHYIATANQCRSWSCTWSYYSVVAGHREDVEWVEMLYTSLMLQMEQELAAADRPEWTDGRTYRANFMESFASTVSGRLSVMGREAVAKAAEASETTSESVTLVLRGRESRVSDWVDSNHKFVSCSRSRSDYCDAARTDGSKAGNRADISAGRTGRINTRKAITG